MADRAIEAALYTLPSLIPPEYKSIALVVGANLPASLLPIRFTPGIPASLKSGVVVYNHPGDIIPANMLKAMLASVYSGTPTAPVPSLGAELVVNGGFGADTDWTKDAGWSIAAGVASADGSADIYLSPTVTILSPGKWYQVVLDITARTAGSLRVQLHAVTIAGLTTVATHTQTGRSGGTDLNLRGLSFNGSIDNVSTKQLTVSSLLTLVADPGTRYGIADSAPTLTAGTQCGHWIWVDDETNPLYGVLAYHDGTSAILEKLVNGVYTQLVKVTTTYSAGAQCRTVAVLDGATPKVGLYYNGALIGTVQSIADAGFGTKVCAFSTLAANTPGTMSVYTGIGA